MLGSGSFGEVATRDGRAVKRERRDVQATHRNTIEVEYEVLRHLQGSSALIPRVFGLCRRQGALEMEMELLGPSLADVRAQDGRYGAAKLLGVANNCMLALAAVHAKGIAHRDVSPGNFLFSIDPRRAAGRPCVVKLIDFGLSKSFMRAGRHTPPREGSRIVGTLRYCGLDAHAGYGACSRRADAQSLALTLLSLHARLPWAGLPKSSREERIERVHELKRRCDADAEAGEGPFEGAPSAVRALWRAARAVRWAEPVDLRGLAAAASEERRALVGSGPRGVEGEAS